MRVNLKPTGRGLILVGAASLLAALAIRSLRRPQSLQNRREQVKPLESSLPLEGLDIAATQRAVRAVGLATWT